MKKKTLAIALAVVLVLCCAVGGTLAWLSDKTDPVTNTFTAGDISIDLTETFNTDKDGNGTNDAWEGKMVPGNTLAKDPTVTVKANSEACWLFVKVEKTNNPDDYLTYTIDSGWKALTGVDGVYYREVAASTTDQSFAVLTGNQVVVKNTVTKTMLETAKTSAPTLTFTAYAVQKDNVTNAAEAWNVAKTL